MEMINELLEKYFQANTTLAEEQKLKRYFSGNDIKPEHEIYRPLFDAFANEKQVELPRKNIQRIPQKPKRWLIAVSLSGIAASFALVLILSQPFQSDTYAIVSGERINNSQFATQYADAKLEKAFAILNRGTEPLQKVERMQESTDPFRKIGRATEIIDNKMNDLEKKIQQLPN